MSSDRRIGMRTITGLGAAALAVLVGAPTFAAAAVGEPGTRTRDITLDGHEDILSRKTNGQLVIYPHNGSFDPGNPAQTYPPRATPINGGWNSASWISTADVTGDGKADVLAQAGDRITVYQHSGTYDPANPYATLSGTQPFGGAGWSLFDEKVLQDFTGDGIADMMARRGGDLFVWPVQVTDGRIEVLAPIQTGEGFVRDDQFDAADLDGDGYPELIARYETQLWAYFAGEQPGARSATTVRHYGSAEHARAAGTQARAAAEPRRQLLSNGWEHANMTTTKDVNSDGKPDLVSRLRATGELLAFLHTGAGTSVSFSGRNYLGTTWRTDSHIN